MVNHEELAICQRPATIQRRSVMKAGLNANGAVCGYARSIVWRHARMILPRANKA